MTAVGKQRAVLAGDACLLTAGAFSVLTGIGGALAALSGVVKPESGPPPGVVGVILQAVAFILMASSVVVGPGAAWLLHRRRIGWPAVIGAVLGVVVGFVALQGLFVLIMLGGMAIAKITGMELAGLIVMIVIGGAAFLALVVALDIDAVRDLSLTRREHRNLDIARVAATIAVAIFLAVSIGLNVANPKSEIGEAGIFALASGAFGAALVTVADVVTTFIERRRGGAGAKADMLQ